MKILNFGSLNLDHVYQMPHFVSVKETVTALDYRTQVGGKGLNQSIALANAGLHVYHAGKIGKDGHQLKMFLQDHGVNTSFVFESEKASGHATIQVVNGQNCIIVYGGANRDIEEKMIDQVFDSFDEGDLLLLQNEINLLDILLKRAHQKKMRIILNPSPIDETLLSAPIELCDRLILNEVEGMALASCESKNYEDIIHALANQFPHIEIVLTCGEKGAWAYQEGNYFYQEAYPVTVVDTTCAGDTFTGFYISACIQGHAIQRALQIACKAASFSVQKNGAADSIPLWDAVMRK